MQGFFTRKLGVFLMMIILCLPTIQAQDVRQSATLMVTSFGTEQGLSQSMVAQICQDSRGLMWMVTGDGLQCFNGEEFRLFKLEYNMNHNNSENIMREIMEHAPGKFTLTTSSSILQFNSASGKFNAVFSKAGLYPRLLNFMVNGRPLCWSSELGYNFVEGNKLVPLKFLFQNGVGPGRTDYPNTAAKTRYGKILICSADGIIEFEEAGRIDKPSRPANWILLKEGCQGMANDWNGETYVLSGRQILIYKGNGLFRHYIDLGDIHGDYLFIDREQNFWISDNVKKKLFRFHQDRHQEIILQTIEGKNTTTINPLIISIFEDRQGNFWFGSDGEGVLLHSPGFLQFDRSSIGFIRCLTESMGQIIAGTYCNGLWRCNPDLSMSVRINPRELGNNLYFLDLATDHQGRIWAYTDHGLFVLDASGKVIFKLPGTVASAAFLPSEGDLIRVVAYTEIQVFASAGTPRLISRKPYAQVRELLKIEDKFWFGTAFGIYRCNAGSEFNNIVQFDSKNRLTEKSVFAFFLLNDTVWSATESGIDCYNLKGNKLQPPACLSEISNEVIYSIRADQLHRLWFDGIKGIGVLLQGRDRIIMFNSKNNLQSPEFNSNAFLTASNGRIYFGGTHGLNGLDPKQFHPQKSGPDVRLFSLHISDSCFFKGIPPEKIDIEISRKHPSLSGSVFSSDYPNSGMFKFSFLLQGYQDEWSKPDKDPSFTYRNLPPGHYHLWARCMDAYKNMGTSRLLISFIIRPPYWKTWWFIGAMLVFTLFITVIIVRKIQQTRYKTRLKELVYQNAIEKERLRISKDMHDEIGASLTRISILSELAKKQDQDTGKALQLVDQISQISGNVVDEMSEIIWAINPKNDNLESFASYLRHFASEFLELAGISSQFSFPPEIPAMLMTAEHRRNIFLTVKEALHNIVKHSQCSMVRLSLSFEGKQLSITVEDNGSGFTMAITTTGNGLINMKKRIEDLGGLFELFSTPGKGTRISLAVILDNCTK